MPTAHINEKLWREIEKKTVSAVIELNKSVKETEMLGWLISIGLKNIKPEDYAEMKKSKKE